MPYISHEYKFIFFAAPATGSTSVIDSLQQAGIGEYCPVEDLHRDGEFLVSRKHGTLEQLRKANLLVRECETYTKVTGLRNPFSWYVAKYLRDKNKRARQARNGKSWINRLPEAQKERYVKRLEAIEKMSFDQYLKLQFRKNEPFEVQAPFHHEVNLFLHQEILAKDAAQFCQKLNIDKTITVGAVNVTGAMPDGKSYRDFYDSELIDLVYRINKPYFDRFPEYSFDGLDESKIAAT